jgi:DNA-binding response OmpR family regulator
MLNTLGYNVLRARRGKEAIQVHAKHKARINLVILDAVMPDMGGDEVYIRMRENNPGVKVLFSSGYGNVNLAGTFQRGGIHCIQKPFDIKHLSAKIGTVLG